MPDTHPSPQQLRAFTSGRIPEAERAALEDHLASCNACCDFLASAPDDGLVERLRAEGTKILVQAGEDTSISPGAPTTEIPAELREHPRYHLLSMIGIGGMGIIYQAEHRMMERLVAIKVIDPRLTQKASAIARFRREVKAAARLTHPNIVSAYDAEQAGDLHFLVMEFVPGLSLARYVEKNGPLPPRFAASCIRQAALGLQHAFEQGMVHRDIKPQNLMLTPQGRVKILDFGLSRFAREEVAESQLEGQSPSFGQGDLTTHGTVMGTPDYIAPEQIRDPRGADHRADLYSLGCTLYFLLTGRAPFATEPTHQKLISHGNQAPAIDPAAKIPADLLVVLRKLMAKSPADRYATPREVADALLPLVQPSSPPAAPTPPPLPAEPAIVAPPIVRAKPEGDDQGATRRALMLGAIGLGGVVCLGGALLGWSWFARAQRVLLVVPPTVFDIREVEILTTRLRAAGVEVVIGSTVKTAVATSFPTPGQVESDLLLSAVRPGDYDAIVFCQGRVREVLDEGVSIVAARARESSARGRAPIFAASGDALIVLKNSGQLRGRAIACPPEKIAMMRQQLQSGDSHSPSQISEEGVVVSLPIITSQGPKHADPFASAILSALRGK